MASWVARTLIRSDSRPLSSVITRAFEFSAMNASSSVSMARSRIAIDRHLCCGYRRQRDAVIGLVCLVTRTEHSLGRGVRGSPRRLI